MTLIECEGGDRAQDLYDRLIKYRLRQDVQISMEPDVPVYAIWEDQRNRPSEEQQNDFGDSEIPRFRDPRHPEMGYRSYEKPQNQPEVPFDIWDKHRISLCIPDGSRDLIPEKSTLDEGRIDQLNGLSYDKGCYVGQELTARMHYRGLGKKHLYTVDVENLPKGAELRSSCDGIGLALVKDEVMTDE